mmetsp:Transcript_123352/g.356516  ORF Transcript_123352/g.356516 Transcript_123352/m.356516 type:complete len:200 (+) Transcript_123352:639-1238(+)
MEKVLSNTSQSLRQGASSASPRPSSSPANILTMETPTHATAKPKPMPSRAMMWKLPNSNLIGSSMPSAFGSWPVKAKRTHCTVKKDIASAKMSFSASPTDSLTSCARLPGLPDRLASSRSLFRKTELPRNMTRRNKAVNTTAKKHVAGLRRPIADCCIAQPTEIAAKPAMWANKAPKHLLSRMRVSNASFFKLTATSMP